MKNVILLALILIGFAGIAEVELIPKMFSRPTFMDLDTAKVRFGQKKFNPEKFKNGDMNVRRTMAVDLIKSKTFLGKKRSEVIETLGEPTGYYISETFPAYLIFVHRDEPQEVWQLLFTPDKSGKILEVKIHSQLSNKK